MAFHGSSSDNMYGSVWCAGVWVGRTRLYALSPPPPIISATRPVPRTHIVRTLCLFAFECHDIPPVSLGDTLSLLPLPIPFTLSVALTPLASSLPPTRIQHAPGIPFFSRACRCSVARGVSALGLCLVTASTSQTAFRWHCPLRKVSCGATLLSCHVVELPRCRSGIFCAHSPPRALPCCHACSTTDCVPSIQRELGAVAPAQWL